MTKPITWIDIDPAKLPVENDPHKLQAKSVELILDAYTVQMAANRVAEDLDFLIAMRTEYNKANGIRTNMLANLNLESDIAKLCDMFDKLGKDMMADAKAESVPLSENILKMLRKARVIE